MIMNIKLKSRNVEECAHVFSANRDKTCKIPRHFVLKIPIFWRVFLKFAIGKVQKDVIPIDLVWRCAAARYFEFIPVVVVVMTVLYIFSVVLSLGHISACIWSLAALRRPLALLDTPSPPGNLPYPSNQ